MRTFYATYIYWYEYLVRECIAKRSFICIVKSALRFRNYWNWQLIYCNFVITYLFRNYCNLVTPALDKIRVVPSLQQQNNRATSSTVSTGAPPATAPTAPADPTEAPAPEPTAHGPSPLQTWIMDDNRLHKRDTVGHTLHTTKTIKQLTRVGAQLCRDEILCKFFCLKALVD